MAKIIGLGQTELTPDSEKKVAKALSALSDEWYVLHSISWQSIRHGRQGDGEADFLLLHPRFGSLVLEVKGGGIEIQNGRWLTEDRYGHSHEIKNPFQQAKDSKYALLAWIEDRFPGFKLSLGHAVVFPDMHEIGKLGPEAPGAITWNAVNLTNIVETVKNTYAHWELKASLSPEQLRAIVDALAPTISIKRQLAISSAEAEQKIINLTAQQIEFYRGLRTNRGALILGGAGTGKTVLAIARAQQLSDDEFRTLLVCYNELLGDVFERETSRTKNLVASTFHAFCVREARKAGLQIPASPSSEWWEQEAPNVLIEAASKNGTSFDAIVIDEGQDFAPSWLDALRCIQDRKKDAPFYMFADPNQVLRARNWTPDGDWGFQGQLTINLRNTLPIAEKVTSVMQLSRPTNGPSGPKPKWSDAPDTKLRNRFALRVIETLIDEGFGPGRLIVLCASPTRVHSLREATVGSYSLGAWGSRGIAVESIARFKGLEAEAVVVVLDETDLVASRNLIYVGFSRARAVLNVVGPPSLKNLLGWDQVVSGTSK